MKRALSGFRRVWSILTTSQISTQTTEHIKPTDPAQLAIARQLKTQALDVYALEDHAGKERVPQWSDRTNIAAVAAEGFQLPHQRFVGKVVEQESKALSIFGVHDPELPVSHPE